MARIELHDLAKSYDATVAVSGVSLDVAQGELVALLGPSGCGKTTTLRMIAGFIEATKGRILIGGRDVTHLPPYRRDTGMVFQGYALFPHMTVAENVAFGLEMRRVEKNTIAPRVAEALRLVRLEGLGARLPRELSGGQQQRVALARALVVNPAVFLLDEPLSNLDAKLRHEVRIEIRQLQQRLGLTTIFVTHDQEEALTLADRLVLMSKGTIQQIGRPEDLYNRPANLFVADFIGKANVIRGRLAEPGIFASAGGMAVRCDADAQRSGAVPGGSAAALVLRPERIALTPAPIAGRANNIAGSIERLTYLGPMTEYLVRCQSGEALTVHGVNGTENAPLAAGAPVWAGWEPAAGLVLADDGTQIAS
jgi:putative spermidine/putrescine transport system ATP-binding protein